jgi:hypothetical protein
VEKIPTLRPNIDEMMIDDDDDKLNKKKKREKIY